MNAIMIQSDAYSSCRFSIVVAAMSICLIVFSFSFLILSGKSFNLNFFEAARGRRNMSMGMRSETIMGWKYIYCLFKYSNTPKI